MKITLPQQSLNLLRTFLQQPGWAKTTKDIYVGGRLLCETLPEPDVTWVKTQEAVDGLTADQRKAYRETDQAWCATPIDIEVTDGERDCCRKAIEKLVEQGAVGSSKWCFKLMDAFGFKPES